jgi:hypothetical protein
MEDISEVIINEKMINNFITVEREIVAKISEKS